MTGPEVGSRRARGLGPRRPMRLLGTALATSAVAISGAPSRADAGTGCPSHWVGSWATAPSNGSVSEPILRDQTLRMIIAPHLSGRTVRLHFTNRYGATPVRIGPVTLADKGPGASVAASTITRVLFAGRTTVTIPAGGSVVSEATAFRVAPFRDLAVSVDVPGTVLHPTEHYVTRQLNYLSAEGSGNLTADPSGSGFAPVSTSGSQGWYFLDGLDVRASGKVGAVVAFGDSITEGDQTTAPGFSAEVMSTASTNSRYPDFLARRLLRARIPLSVLNEGIGNNELLGSLSGGIAPTGGPSGLARFQQDVVDQPGVTDVIVLLGINDIGARQARAPALIAGYKELIARAHAAHLRIQLGTLTPWQGAFMPFPTQALATWKAVNAWIRSQHLSNGIVDFDAAVRDPSDPLRIRPGYGAGDHIHMTPAGYKAMAAAVPLRRLARPVCTRGDRSTPM